MRRDSGRWVNANAVRDGCRAQVSSGLAVAKANVSGAGSSITIGGNQSAAQLLGGDVTVDLITPYALAGKTSP